MWVTIMLSVGGTLVKNSVDMVLRPFIKFIVLALLIAVALAVLVTMLIARSKRAKIQKEADDTINELNTRLQLGQASLESLRSSSEQQLRGKDELIAQMARNYEKNLDDIRASQKETLKSMEEQYKAQAAALKAELTAQTEQLLKQREEALSSKAKGCRPSKKMLVRPHPAALSGSEGPRQPTRPRSPQPPTAQANVHCLTHGSPTG